MEGGTCRPLMLLGCLLLLQGPLLASATHHGNRESRSENAESRDPTTAILSAPSSTSTPVNCELDDDFTNQHLEACYRKADKFLKKYMQHLRSNGRKTRRKYNICTGYAEFRRCLQPMVEQCPAIRQQVDKHWRGMTGMLDCACGHAKGNSECHKHLECFEKQANSLLVKRCDTYFKFNIQQKTKDKCFFTNENIRCKEALVSSACGEEAGNFAFHVHKLSARHKIPHGTCKIDRQAPYDGFHYSAECPSNLTTQMDKCDEEHLQDTMLYFYEENDLVVEGGKRDIRMACRDLKAYKGCVRDIRKSCHTGTNMVYEYDEMIRTYKFKVDYICTEAKDDYWNNLRCYQEVLKNKTLKVCADIWHELKPKLDDMTAYQFYCQASSDQSVGLQDLLTDMRECYADIFNAKCGLPAGKAMSKLMQLAFEDPFYLRFEYKPDCSLHRTHPPPTQRSPSVPARTEKNREGGKNTHKSNEVTHKASSVAESKGSNAEAVISSSSLAILTFLIKMILFDR